MAKPVSLHLYHALMTGLSAFLPLYLSQRAKKGKEDSARLCERYGRGYAPLPEGGTRIWLHGVSVGEVTAVLALARALLVPFKDAHFIITTGTTTAAALVQKAADELPLTHYYAPFDAPRFVRRFLGFVAPDFGVIFESDYWPTLMTSAHEGAIPLYLASAQMSQRSAKRWQKSPQLAQAMFAPIAGCYAHDDKQTAQFQALGIAPSQTIGSLKLPPIAPKITDFAKQIKQAGKGRIILLGASTHEGEEAQILAISDHLSARNCDHLLIIAPRHPNRGDSVAAMMGPVKRRAQGAIPDSSDSRYLCDSLGDMASLYQAADIVWLGATFSGKGGHNPLEPASYGKLVICGPSHYKNQYEFDQLTAQGVCHQILDARATAQFIATITDDDRHKDVAKTGKAYAKAAAKRPMQVAQLIAQSYKKATL